MSVISVEHLSKSYRLGALGGGTLRADVSRWLAKLRGLPDPNLQIGQEHQARLEGQEFWALREVSFEVKEGEILGIIGRNGAGKSTLLKILSRVTAPSSGLVKVRGRIASLLEVGTGFHPELTGRENIFLNGAILGMSKAEIKKKFDDIVAFSEVEAFIDTPVKRYSSGMYVRLAFAVAAHLEPEILIVDEVLAVGDAQFQKKCLGKMQDVSVKDGRTVLFVSHSMSSVSRLCQSGLLMQGGKNVLFGNIHAVVTKYNEHSLNAASEACWPDDNAPGNNVAKLRSVRILGEAISKTKCVDIAQGCSVAIDYEILESEQRRSPIAAIQLINDDGVVLFASADFQRHQATNGSRAGLKRAVCHIPGRILSEGHFTVLVGLVNYNPNIVHALAREAVSFQAVAVNDYQTNGECLQDWPGVVRPHLEWS
jgi:lipopolysaccharide transport system ATP-binding protein